jgi:hypothetical protein
VALDRVVHGKAPLRAAIAAIADMGRMVSP